MSFVDYFGINQEYLTHSNHTISNKGLVGWFFIYRVSATMTNKGKKIQVMAQIMVSTNGPMVPPTPPTGTSQKEKMVGIEGEDRAKWGLEPSTYAADIRGMLPKIKAVPIT